MNNYTTLVRQINEGGEVIFEARVREFPDIIGYGASASDAHTDACLAIEAVSELLKEIGREVPAPIMDELEYSGRVTLRLPKSLHRLAAIKADSEAVSLNQHLLDLISRAYGSMSGIPAYQKSGKLLHFEAAKVVVLRRGSDSFLDAGSPSVYESGEPARVAPYTIYSAGKH